MMRRGMSREAMKWVGRLSKTADSSVSLPPLDKREAHQPAKYLSTLSMSGWNADGGVLKVIEAMLGKFEGRS
jgi:hypothetical protein